MKNLKNRKVLIAMSIVLAMIIMASATFAWVTSKNTMVNEFMNEGFGNGSGLVVNENFPEPTLEIGVTTPKEVSVTNTGASPMLARITFEEMIKLLGNDGAITPQTTAAVPAGMIRVPFDINSVSGGAWEEITGRTFAPALPGTVRVFKIGSVYKACHEYEPGKYQVVNFSARANADSTSFTDVVLSYSCYTEGTAKFNSWNLAHNYDKWDAQTLLGIKPADKDKSTVNTAEVTLTYGSTFAAVPTQDKWFYHPDDGYFYYIGVLAGGETTPVMLEGVHLEGTANQDTWQKHEYTLVVAVEGLQANKAALLDTDTATGPAAGWKLPAGSLLNALNDAIDTFNANA
ncbi:MAG: hypothetical protein FWH26_05590 [Oscillospiraceae bacterium]|nr:hypothetical protein [Oscillospiraceae bacterium]